MEKIKIYFKDNVYQIVDNIKFEELLKCLENTNTRLRLVAFPKDNLVINMDNVLFIERIEKNEITNS